MTRPMHISAAKDKLQEAARGSRICANLGERMKRIGFGGFGEDVFIQQSPWEHSWQLTRSDCLDTVLQLRPSFAWHKPDCLRS